MLRTFALFALSVFALAATATAQCTSFRGGCADPTNSITPQIVCSGAPNACCQNFTINGRGFSTTALGTTLLLSDCTSRVALGPPVGCDASCVLYLTPLVFVPIAVGGAGSISQPFPVPCDPTIVGGRFCVQGAQVVVDASGAVCVSLTDAIQITIGPRGSC